MCISQIQTSMVEKMTSDVQVIQQVKHWLNENIIGLNFCPFAKKEFVNNTIAYPVLRNVDLEESLVQLVKQCHYLDENPNVSTALVIFAEDFGFFDDYLDLVAVAEDVLIGQGYEGTYQLASFHPDYYFEGVEETDVSNFTNRSPYPILHVIREDDLARAVKAHPDPEGIPDKNIEVCHQKGKQYFESLLSAIKAGTHGS